MNTYIKAQILNMISMTRIFKQTCETAARKDDGVVTREEQKLLNEINKAADEFVKRLERINK